MKLAKTDTITPQCLSSLKSRGSERERERESCSKAKWQWEEFAQYSKFFLAVLIPLGLVLSTILNVLGYQNHSVYAIDCTALSSEELLEKYGDTPDNSSPSDSAISLLTEIGVSQEDYKAISLAFDGYADSIDIGTDEQKCDIIEYGSYLRENLDTEPVYGTDRQTAINDCAATLDMKIFWVLDIGKMICTQIFAIQDSVTMFMQILGVFMEYRMLVQDSGTNLISSAWSQFLIFANIVFAILFLIVIFSTATSVGLSNYSIKRILPRLILIAIAVNISYYICAAIVDLSNIVGTSLLSLFDSIINDTLAGTSTSSSSIPSVMSDHVVAGVLAGATINFLPALLVLFLILGIIILIGIIGVFIMLAFRQVMLTLLVIISPLAFVCLLLVNTETWFKKWLKAFLQLLMIFPILMGLTGACHFVSTIMLLSPASSSGDFVSQLFGILMSLVLAILPMLLIWPVTKRFSGLAGQLTAKVASGTVKVGKSAAAVGMTAATMGMGAAAAGAAGGSKLMGAAKAMGGKVGNAATALEKRAVSGTGMIANSKIGKRINSRYHRQQIGESANARRAKQEAILSNPDLANSPDEYISTAYYGESRKVFDEQVTMEDAKAKANNQSQDQIETIIKQYKERGTNSGHSKAKVASAIGRWQPKADDLVKIIDRFPNEDKDISDLLTAKLATADTGSLTSASMIDDVRKGDYKLDVSIRKKALGGEYDLQKFAHASPDIAKLADAIIMSTRVGDVIGKNNDGSDKIATQADVDTIHRNYGNLIKTTSQTDRTRAQMTSDATKNAIYERYNSPPSPLPPVGSVINTDSSNFTVQEMSAAGMPQDIDISRLLGHINAAAPTPAATAAAAPDNVLKLGLEKLLRGNNGNIKKLIEWQTRHASDPVAQRIVNLAVQVNTDLAWGKKQTP